MVNYFSKYPILKQVDLTQICVHIKKTFAWCVDLMVGNRDEQSDTGVHVYYHTKTFPVCGDASLGGALVYACDL